jgi:hypothetical protein
MDRREPLFVGLYNKSTSFVKDFSRNEMMSNEAI